MTSNNDETCRVRDGDQCRGEKIEQGKEKENGGGGVQVLNRVVREVLALMVK